MPLPNFSVILFTFGLGVSGLAAALVPTDPASGGRAQNSALPYQQVNLSGSWEGKLYQNEGGIAPEFDFVMDITHHGAFVRGKSYVTYQGIWAEMSFTGHQDANGHLVIGETKVLRAKKPDDLSWCMKEYELRMEFTGVGIILTGPWWGDSAYGPCVPGSVRLWRKIKQA